MVSVFVNIITLYVGLFRQCSDLNFNMQRNESRIYVVTVLEVFLAI